jgi:hypothetical protein
MLRLPVRLWVEGCREPMVSAQFRTFPEPESASKLSALVHDDVVRYAAFANDVLKEEPRQFR